MKKVIVAILLFACCSSLSAQSVDEYGLPVNSLYFQTSDGIGEVFADALISSFGPLAEAVSRAFIASLFNTDPGETTKWEHGTPTPYLTVAYEHHFPGSRWNLGGEVGYWHCSAKTLNNDPVIVTHTNFGSLAATAKLFYKPSGICKLYGGLNLGVATFVTSMDSLPATKSSDSGDDIANGDSSAGEAPVLPAIQFNPIGMRLGGERVAFVAELGIGYKGILQLGLNVGL